MFSTYKKKYRPANKNARNERDLEIPQMKQEHFRSWDHELKRTFPNFAKVSIDDRPAKINQLSVCCDNLSFVSADNLQLLLWNIENCKSAFKILDLKPEEIEDIDEMITSVQFHPFRDHQLICSSSKGIVRLCDLRTASTADDSALMITENPDGVYANVLAEILSSISDACWMPDGRHILTRQFLYAKLWDINMPNKPVDVFPVYLPLKHKLSELAINEKIFEPFNISPSPCGNYFTTGMFNGNIFITNIKDKSSLKVDLSFSKKTSAKPFDQQGGPVPELPATYNFDLKVNDTHWHPSKNIICCSAMNSMFIYSGLK